MRTARVLQLQVCATMPRPAKHKPEVKFCPNTHLEEGWEMRAQDETTEEVGLPG